MVLITSAVIIRFPVAAAKSRARFNNLFAIINNYAGGPVGIDNLAAALSEPADTIEDVIEPYLMQLGLIQRTPRGRVVTDAGYKHMGLEK